VSPTTPLRGPPPRDYAPSKFDPLNGGLPSDVTTLDHARRGQVLEVRCVLDGAGESAAMLRPGDRVVCRGRTSQWVVVELVGRGEYAIHRHDARCIRIERGG
jgi:hypothetical protein